MTPLLLFVLLAAQVEFSPLARPPQHGDHAPVCVWLRTGTTDCVDDPPANQTLEFSHCAELPNGCTVVPEYRDRVEALAVQTLELKCALGEFRATYYDQLTPAQRAHLAAVSAELGDEVDHLTVMAAGL